MAEAAQSEVPSEIPWTEPNGIYATYDLHCHCGAVKYKMKISPPLYVEQTEGKAQCRPVDCDCSFCARNGLLNVHPLAEDVEFTQGLQDRKEYFYASKTFPIWLCRHCGSVLGSDISPLMQSMGMEDRYTVNVRHYVFVEASLY